MPGSDAAMAAGAGADLSPGERAELERLRTEVQQLRRQRAPAARRRRPGWRAPVATALIVIGCLLAPFSVLAVWTANEVSNTDRYVANVEPLIHEPAIQNALTDKITSEITSRLDVAGLASQAGTDLSGRGLPRVGALLRTFAPSLASAVAGFVHTQVYKIVTSAAVARLWVQANRIAHAQLVKAVSGRGGSSITVSNGQVSIGLGPFIDAVKEDLSARGFTLVNRIPPVNPTVPLFSTRDLVKAQTGYRLINDLKIVLPILTLVLLAAGVYLARSHRKALIGAGLGLAASMAALGVGLAIFRTIYLNTVPASVLPSDAAAALFDTVIRFIRQGLRVLLVLGLVVAAGAFFSGPSVTAVRTRAAFVSGLGWIRESGEHAGLRTGPVGRWTYAHRVGLRIGVTALAALILVFWGQPTGLVVLLLAVLLLIALGLIELIGRRPARPEIASHAGGE
jgi:hypothetical protein